jgi:hypothetical protein
MPLLFSYGTLQQEAVQLSTFGRRVDGKCDHLIGFELSFFDVEDPAFVAASGKAAHRIVTFTGNQESRVAGMALEVSESELAQADRYEPAGYTRMSTVLASGRTAWVYAADAVERHR